MSAKDRSIYAIQPIAKPPRGLLADAGDFCSGMLLLGRFLFGLAMLAVFVMYYCCALPRINERAREYDRQGVPYGYTTGPYGLRTGVVPLGLPRNSDRFRD